MEASPRKATTSIRSSDARGLPGATARALALPFAFTVALAAAGFVTEARGNPRLLWAFLGTALILAAWMAVLLVHAHGWSYAEVADVLDIRVSAVRNHVHRGLTKLRTHLEQS